MKKLMTAILLVGAATGFAGDKGGNGGDVCVFPDGSATLLDHEEGETRQIYYNLGTPRENYKSHLEEALNRIEKFSSAMALRFEKRIKELSQDIDQFREDLRRDPEILRERNSFYNIVRFTTDKLTDIPDSNHNSLPKDCTIKQVVIQKTPQFKGEKRYDIDKKLFVKLDEVAVAGLVLHEVIYREYFENEWSDNSLQTRSLNTIISSNIIEQMNLTSFLKELNNLKYPVIEIEGYMFQTKVGRSDHFDSFYIHLANRERIPLGGKVEDSKSSFSGQLFLLNSGDDWPENPISATNLDSYWIYTLFDFKDGSIIIDDNAIMNKMVLEQVQWLKNYGECLIKYNRSSFFKAASFTVENAQSSRTFHHKDDELRAFITSGFCD